MYCKFYAIVMCFCSSSVVRSIADDDDRIELVDMTRPTNWKELMDYYNAVEKRWKMCVNCGSPGLGTAMHLEYSPTVGSMHPAIIPAEYLLTRLVIVDVSSHTIIRPDFVLSLEVALQWPVLKHDPREPTLLLFKFGWKDDRPSYRAKSCVCTIPGISYELAEWIAANMTHVVGVATDAPSLESEETRELATRTVANLLGKNGVYMIENIAIRKKIPEQHCMAMAMPLKLLNQNYVPTRVTAFCPTMKTDMNVVVAMRGATRHPKHITTHSSRVYDVDMEEILNMS